MPLRARAPPPPPPPPSRPPTHPSHLPTHPPAQFLVKWKGLPYCEATYETMEDMQVRAAHAVTRCGRRATSRLSSQPCVGCATRQGRRSRRSGAAAERRSWPALPPALARLRSPLRGAAPPPSCVQACGQAEFVDEYRVGAPARAESGCVRFGVDGGVGIRGAAAAAAAAVAATLPAPPPHPPLVLPVYAGARAPHCAEPQNRGRPADGVSQAGGSRVHRAARVAER